MWWRFLTFCVLVTFVLFVVLSCIHGRPVIHLFFHRCCEEDIENDQVIFENFGNNFLRERLVGDDITAGDNEGFVSDNEVEEVIRDMREKLNVHDPGSRVKIANADSKAKASENATNDVETNESSNKALESALNKLDIEGNNTIDEVNKTFNDTASANDVTQRTKGEMTPDNDVVSELESDESVEVTTENRMLLKTFLPIKLVDVSSSYKSEMSANDSVTS